MPMWQRNEGEDGPAGRKTEESKDSRARRCGGEGRRQTGVEEWAGPGSADDDNTALSDYKFHFRIFLDRQPPSSLGT